jgi:hypothetical protein
MELKSGLNKASPSDKDLKEKKKDKTKDGLRRSKSTERKERYHSNSYFRYGAGLLFVGIVQCSMILFLTVSRSPSKENSPSRIKSSLKDLRSEYVAFSSFCWKRLLE